MKRIKQPLLSLGSSFVQQMQSGMFGGGGAAQARAMQQPQPPPQPPVPPLSSSQPSLRAQVPQFLSPQVNKRICGLGSHLLRKHFIAKSFNVCSHKYFTLKAYSL